MTACIMALHIRDFRQSDTQELSRLCETGRLIGVLPQHADGARIFSGVREDRLAAAIWFSLEGGTGTILALVTAPTAHWLSDARELIAEATLWLTSRGAVHIELSPPSEQSDLLVALVDLDFQPDEHAGVLRRIIPARSAA
jgi:GNAT superfamily N-acetyltransferase